MLEPGLECTVLSPCKINPTLEVLGRRPDGQHELWTTLLALDLCDRLRLTTCARASGEPLLSLSSAGPAHSEDIPLNASNLAWRGAQVALDLAQERGLELADCGLELHIEKHIPSQAGLGGGSSNAAAAAFGVARLMGLDPDAPELLEGLARLGADVSFFLAARGTGWGLCRGRGELVEELPLPADDGRVFVLWTPALTCSTAAVYAALQADELHAEVQTEAAEACLRLPIEAAREACRNDLEAAALRSHPGLVDFKRALLELGPGVAGLCGSGSSFYGMFDSYEAASDFIELPAFERIERDFGLRARCIARPHRAGVGD